MVTANKSAIRIKHFWSIHIIFKFNVENWFVILYSLPDSSTSSKRDLILCDMQILFLNLIMNRAFIRKPIGNTRLSIARMAQNLKHYFTTISAKFRVFQVFLGDNLLLKAKFWLCWESQLYSYCPGDILIARKASKRVERMLLEKNHLKGWRFYFTNKKWFQK